MPFTNKKTYTYLVVLLLFIVVFYYVGILRASAVYLRTILSPLTTTMHKLGVNTKNLFTPNLSDNERDIFTQTKEKLSVAETKIKLLEEDSINLQKQLDFKLTSNFQLLTAQVTSRDFENITKTIVINRGEKDGIKINMAVLSETGVLAGKIIKIEKDISFVRLTNDSQTKLSAIALNQDRSLGAVEGGHGLSLRLKFIPRNEILSVGDQVVTSGFDNEIPRGILVGTVAVVENEAYQPFQQAVLTTGTDLNKLLTVSVVIDETK